MVFTQLSAAYRICKRLNTLVRHDRYEAVNEVLGTVRAAVSAWPMIPLPEAQP